MPNQTPDKSAEAVERELRLIHLHVAYYLSGWKLWVWRFFLKHVYQDWENGYKEHWKLIDAGYIGHAGPGVPICCDFPTLPKPSKKK